MDVVLTVETNNNDDVIGLGNVDEDGKVIGRTYRS
jgi:hypothetical protein